MDDGRRAAQQYDAMAAAYADDNLANTYNAAYERPATIALLGEVAGRRVLEVGCGAGPLTSWLVEHHADVTAIDVSPGMLGLARDRVGDAATFLIADVQAPLPFADGGFDLVVASLVLHYVEDWGAALGELRRVLSPDGSVVFSTHHPTLDWQLHSPDDYFAVKQVTEIWPKGGGAYEVTFWRRPLTAMTQAIAAAGFVIEQLVEPQPQPEAQAADPPAFHALATQPAFLFFRLRPAVGPR